MRGTPARALRAIFGGSQRAALQSSGPRGRVVSFGLKIGAGKSSHAPNSEHPQNPPAILGF